MKIIEGMKKIKELRVKIDDLREKVGKHCAISSVHTPEYTDQKKQVAEWIQAHEDILKEILKLRISIQKTNLQTDVTIVIGEKNVTKNIAEWIHRRRDLAGLSLAMYNVLGDRGIREGRSTTPEGDSLEVKIQRFYDPEERDKMVDVYTSEPSTIDSRLEVINAITDLLE